MRRDSISLDATTSNTEFNPLVSFYPNAFENLPTDISAAQFLADIKSGKFASQIKLIRQRFKKAIARGVPYKDAKKAVDSQKKKLGAVTLAGTQAMRGNKFPPQFTGLIQADFDLLGDTLQYYRELLADDPHVFALFLSATGEGLKAFYRIPVCKNADEYKIAFDALAAHVFQLTGWKIDELKEVARLCYASHDKDCLHNPNAVALPVDYSQMPPPVAQTIKTAKSVPSKSQFFNGESRRFIAERILGAVEWESDVLGYTKCPGEHLHTNGNALKDCRVTLDGVPTVFCLHKSCVGVVETANKNLRSQIGKAEFVKPAAPHPNRADIASETSEPVAGATAPRASASPEIIVLPSGSVSISESARAIFQLIAPTRTLFWRGGVLVELVEVNGVQGLGVLKPEKFRSDVEKIGRLYAYRAAGKGEPALKPSKMSFDDAKAILAATEGREFLPFVASVLRCPVLTETQSGDIAILDKDYHPELGGLLIVNGDTPPQVQLAEAVEALRWLVEEFDFQTEADLSRALAAFITPALRLGGFMRGNIPIDCAEADKSQSGKGHRLEMVCTLYNEKSYFVTAKAGGVGSVDESFAAALVSARPFICLDNFRGRMDSQNLEAFLTCPSMFPARIPHSPEVLIDPHRFILQMSSNGLETTRDLANRASICRIRKRPGFQYRDTLGELQRRQTYFLGCVFAVVREWIVKGKPCSQDTRHDFREWSQTLDWIVQNILGCAPLMDGHQAAQERTSNPALTFMRAVALAVAAENRLGDSLIASEIVEICEVHAIKIPGDPGDEGKAKRQVGSLCKQVFRDGESVAVDGFTITRSDKGYRKPSGDMDTTKAYTFSK